jgi:hypothetical protein
MIEPWGFGAQGLEWACCRELMIFKSSFIEHEQGEVADGD